MGGCVVAVEWNSGWMHIRITRYHTESGHHKTGRSQQLGSAVWSVSSNSHSNNSSHNRWLWEVHQMSHSPANVSRWTGAFVTAPVVHLVLKGHSWSHDKNYHVRYKVRNIINKNVSLILMLWKLKVFIYDGQGLVSCRLIKLWNDLTCLHKLLCLLSFL